MLSGDVARYRTEELLRMAEARRSARAVVARRRAARVSAAHRLVAAVTALFPLRH